MRNLQLKPEAKRWPLFSVNVLGLICFLVLLEGFQIQNHFPLFLVTIFFLLAIAVPIIVAEFFLLKSYQHADTGLDFKAASPINPQRVAIKLFGLYASMLMIGILYAIFPEYSKASYDFYWELLKYLIPGTCVLAIPYICVLDKYATDKKDGNWQAGMFFLGRIGAIDMPILKNHFLGWLVKGFFLALMFSYLTGNIHYFQTHSLIDALFEAFTHTPNNFYRTMVRLIFTIDLAYVSIGYILTLRILNSHIRSVEPTLLGWVVALMCYQPFWGLIYDAYLSYNTDNINFDKWLMETPLLLMGWATLILMMLTIYVWATVQFGIRFSNLTHRGIITNGPYKFCKHPAYVSKNISWWLMAVPFISNQGPMEAVKNCLLLACVNGVYYLRAKTEEVHLRRDKLYQAYEAHMKTHSLYGMGKNLLLKRYGRQR